MALGSVSIVSITRKDLKTMIQQAVNSAGKVVYSGTTYFSYNENGVLNIPDSADYVTLTCYSVDTEAAGSYKLPDNTKLVRGGTITTATPTKYYCKITFSNDGKLVFIGYYGGNKASKAYYRVEAYQYY